jgi:hypothetical protein
MSTSFRYSVSFGFPDENTAFVIRMLQGLLIPSRQVIRCDCRRVWIGNWMYSNLQVIFRCNCSVTSDSRILQFTTACIKSFQLAVFARRCLVTDPNSVLCIRAYVLTGWWLSLIASTPLSLIGNGSTKTIPRYRTHNDRTEELCSSISIKSVSCGGGSEYLHSSPASRKRRRKVNPVPGGISGPPCSCGI